MGVQAAFVLLVAPSDDIHALAVAARIGELYGDRVPCYILDCATYPLGTQLEAWLEDGVPGPTLTIAAPLAGSLGQSAGRILLERAPSDRATTVGLGPETVVWWRRYRRPILHSDVVEPEFREFCHEALKATLLGALGLCTVHNPVGAEDKADRKLWQLYLARQCGLHVPRTLIATNRERVRSFVEAIEGEGRRVVYKHAAAIAAFGMPTRIVDAAARARFGTLDYSPAIFQEEVSGGPDLRIAVVGTRIFCCEWRGTSPGRTFVDIKMEDGLRMWPAQFPSGLDAPLLDLHARLGISVGVYDFKLDDAGRAYFLEVNPSGQWLDMEVEGGQPISQSLARFLVEDRGAETGDVAGPYSVADLARIHAGLSQDPPTRWTRVV